MADEIKDELPELGTPLGLTEISDPETLLRLLSASVDDDQQLLNLISNLETTARTALGNLVKKIEERGRTVGPRLAEALMGDTPLAQLFILAPQGTRQLSGDGISTVMSYGEDKNRRIQLGMTLSAVEGGANLKTLDRVFQNGIAEILGFEIENVDEVISKLLRMLEGVSTACAGIGIAKKTSTEELGRYLKPGIENLLQEYGGFAVHLFALLLKSNDRDMDEQSVREALSSSISHLGDSRGGDEEQYAVVLLDCLKGFIQTASQPKYLLRAIKQTRGSSGDNSYNYLYRRVIEAMNQTGDDGDRDIYPAGIDGRTFKRYQYLSLPIALLEDPALDEVPGREQVRDELSGTIASSTT